PRATTRTAFSRWLAALDAAPTVSVLTGTPELAAADAAIQGSGRACFNIFATESAPVLAPLVAAGEPDPRLAEMVDHAAWTGPEGLAAALQVRDELRRTWSALAEQVDVVVTLATTNPAPVGHESTGCRRMPATSSLLGIPALSAPWLEVEGLPQGVQLLGFDGRDEELFDAAALLERAVFTRNEESS
uniref:amidase family protein n=1 Tax=uncultured Aeromicrobium sp. TaxID=337820 RepID=UPI0025CC6908